MSYFWLKLTFCVLWLAWLRPIYRIIIIVLAFHGIVFFGRVSSVPHVNKQSDFRQSWKPWPGRTVLYEECMESRMGHEILNYILLFYRNLYAHR